MYLCEACFEAHIKKAPKGKRHWKMPRLEGKDKRVVNLAGVFVETLMNALEDVKEAQSAAVDSLNQFIREVQKYKVEVLVDLSHQVQVLEKRVEDIIQEVQSFCGDPSPAPYSPALTLMLNFASRDELKSQVRFINLIQSKSDRPHTEILKSFSFMIDNYVLTPSPPPSAVQLIPTFDRVTAYLSPEPFVTSYQAQVEGLMLMDNYTAWSFLRNGNVLIAGAMMRKSVFSFDCVDCFAIPLAETMDFQPFSGIITVKNRVFLLGGQMSGELRTAEVFDVMENKWTYLPDMLSGRSQFQPSLCQEFIYIFGGYQSDRCERLDLHCFQFSSVNLNIPGRSSNISFCHEGVFYIFTRTVVYKWDQTNPLVTLKDGLSIGFFSFMSPIHMRNSVYFLSMNNSERYLMKFDLGSLRLDIALTFGEDKAS